VSHEEPITAPDPVMAFNQTAARLEPRPTQEEVSEVAALLHSLYPGSVTYRLAAPILLQGQARLETAAPLIAVLRTPTAPWKERQVAAWTLGWTEFDLKQQPAAIRALLDVLENRLPVDPGRYGRMLQRSLFSLSVGCAGSILLVVILSMLYFGQGRFHAWSGILMVLLAVGAWIGGLFGSLIYEDSRVDRVRATGVTALGRLHAPESVGALAKAALEPSQRVRTAAIPALRAVLRRLTPNHYGQLGAEAVPGLCRLLGQADEGLTLHLLEALEKVGDGRAVRPVEHLLSGVHTSLVRRTAERILPLLRERQQRENESQMLLRGASEPPAAPEHLLRPTYPGTPSNAPKQLLRPSTASKPAQAGEGDSH